MWISGSRNFIEMVEFGGCGTHVFWMSHSPRRVPIDMADISWSKILHRNVGGVTEARGTFGTSTGSPLIKLERHLQRSLGHIVKYSVRPRVCDPQPVESHYVRSDLLSLSFPRRPLLYYPTSEDPNGYRYRWRVHRTYFLVPNVSVLLFRNVIKLCTPYGVTMSM